MVLYRRNLHTQITPTDPLPKTICETCMTRVEQHHDLMLKIAKTRRLRGQMTITTLLRNEITQTDEQPSIEIVATRNVWNSGVIRQNSTSSSTTISAASSDNRLEDDTVVTTREPTAITTATSISASADMLVDDATETETSSIIVPLNNSNSISDVTATEQLPANVNDNL